MRRRRSDLIALLLSGMTLCYAQRGTLSVAAPFMIRDLAINTETMGLDAVRLFVVLLLHAGAVGLDCRPLRCAARLRRVGSRCGRSPAR